MVVDVFCSGVAKFALRSSWISFDPTLIKLYRTRGLICFSKREISPRRARRTQSKIKLLEYPEASHGGILIGPSTLLRMVSLSNHFVPASRGGVYPVPQNAPCVSAGMNVPTFL